MRIAVLAWGLLIWGRRELSITEDFKPFGPPLPIEFCRMSGDGSLTPVINEAFVASSATYIAGSAIGDLGEAIENLRLGGGMRSAKGVGFVEVAFGTQSDRAKECHSQAVARIRAWAQANGFDAAIWTALARNFHEIDKAAEPFSVDAAIRYLETRDDETRLTALRYIRKEPQEAQTPVRAAAIQRWPEG